MNSTETLEYLRAVRFLHDLADDYLQAIVPITEQVEFPTDGVLFREGQYHPRIYLILDGSVALEIRVSQREIKRLQTVGAGELLGWSPLLGQVEMTATARALQPTRAIAITANQLMALWEQNPRLGLEFLMRTAQALSRRLAATRLQLTDIYSQEMPGVPLGQEG